MKIISIAAGAAALALVALQGPVNAGSIVGGSSMLTAGHVTQLESWLGEGPLTLTNIFTKGVTGTNSADWHSNVDGQGRTFSILEMVASNAQGQTVTQIVGGYNPQSWRSTGPVWSYTNDDVDRTAFIFNLTNSILYRQCLTTDGANCGTDGADNGHRQTRNELFRGPSFGGGFDLYVNGTLDGGYSWNFSYDIAGGLPGDGNQNALDPNPSAWQWQSVGALETFTIDTIPVAALSLAVEESTEISEPELTAVFALGFAGLGLLRRRSRKQSFV